MGRRRGSVLVLAVFFMIATSFVAYAFLVLIPGEMVGARRYHRDAQASQVANGGVQDALLWMEARVAGGDPPTGELSHEMLPGWTYDVTVTGPVGPTADLEVYQVVSRAREEGDLRRRAVAFVQREGYGDFVRLEDRHPTDIGLIVGRTLVDGPYHSNQDWFLLEVNNPFYASGGPPIFTGTYSQAAFREHPWDAPPLGDGFGYRDQGDTPGVFPFDPLTGEPDATRYGRIFSQGREGLKVNAERVELPVLAPHPLLAKAWTGAPPATAGVHLDAAGTAMQGGVLINGNANSLRLSVDSSDNGVMTIQTGTVTTRVTAVSDGTITSTAGTPVNPPATLVERTPGGETVYTGLPNGAVFCTGSISALEGENRGRKTIAAAAAVNITDDLTRHDTTPGQRPSGREDALGVVGREVTLTRLARDRNNADPLYLYALILAGEGQWVGPNPQANGGFYVEHWDWPSAGSQVVEYHGGLLTAYKGGVAMTGGLSVYVGHFWFWSWRWGWQWLPYYEQQPSFGITQRFYHDHHMVQSPPPHFPTRGTFAVRTWSEEAAGE